MIGSSNSEYISFAIHLRANRAGFASENIRIVAEINELCAMSLAN